MSGSSWPLVVVALTFAFVTGVNDGGAMMASALRLPSIPLVAAAALLVSFVVVAPMVFGTKVATTFASRLVIFQGGVGQRAMLAGVLTAMGVVLALTARGLPTSLTLAVVGGLSGAGFGAGLSVAWSRTLLVLAVGLVAPLFGFLVAELLVLGASTLPNRWNLLQRLGTVHRFTFALQCLAYSVNDGQKMLGVWAVATTTTVLARGVTGFVHLLALGTVFAVGLAFGLRRVSHSLGSALLPLRPLNVVVAELAASGAVLSAATVGVPVSMTQSLAGAFVGSGMRSGYRRVRWEEASRIGLAWLFTLPLSVVGAALLSAAITRGAR